LRRTVNNNFYATYNFQSDQAVFTRNTFLGASKKMCWLCFFSLTAVALGSPEWATPREHDVSSPRAGFCSTPNCV